MADPTLADILRNALDGVASHRSEIERRAKLPTWGDTRWMGSIPLPAKNSLMGEYLSEAPLEAVWGSKAGPARVAAGAAARAVYDAAGWSPTQLAKHAVQKGAIAGSASASPYFALRGDQQTPTPPGEEKFDLEKTVLDAAARKKWGPDMPWYLPESMVGDVPYRYQGIGLHSGLAALPGMPLWARLGNLGYVGYSVGAGRYQRPGIEDLDFPAEATDPPRTR